MLTLNSISFGFGSKTIFENLNLSFENRHTYGIVGSNGVGKTTLFRTISRLYSPKSGNILFDQQPLNSTQVAFLPTDPFFYPYMKGAEYLEIIHQDASVLNLCFEWSEKLNLPLDNLVDTYSTGMKKKLAFIASYAQNRPVSIYDEPFNGVDLESNEVLISLLQKQNTEKITLISSHILTALFEICDTIIHIEKGFNTTFYSPDHFDQLKQKIRAGV